MKLEDIKVGMKVKLLGKHGAGYNYDNIEDWFKDNEGWDCVKQIKEQGYGVVVEIEECGAVWVDGDISNDGWCFLPLDLEPYDEEDELDKTKPNYIPSPTMDVKIYDKNNKVIFEGEMDLLKDDKKSVVDIKDLVYDIENGTTIVYFTDGTKKIARTEEGTEFDKEVGLLECLGKKLFGNRGGLLKVIESGKVIKRKKNKPIKEKIDNAKISDENVFDRFLKGEKIAINCETEEEAKNLFAILNRQGVKWIESEELSIDDTEWARYEKDTCYDNSERELQFGSSACYERQGYTIVKFKDYFQ